MTFWTIENEVWGKTIVLLLDSIIHKLQQQVEGEKNTHSEYQQQNDHAHMPVCVLCLSIDTEKERLCIVPRIHSA